MIGACPVVEGRVRVTDTACAIAWLGRGAVWRHEGSATVVVTVTPEAAFAGQQVIEWAAVVYDLRVDHGVPQGRTGVLAPADPGEQPGDVADRLVTEWCLAGGAYAAGVE